MFAFSDATLLNAVLAAKRRGVAVQVMLNPERRSGERDNDHTRRVLARGHVAVKDANPEFDLTHEKSMIVDDHTGFVQSCNWVTNTLTKARDYAVVTTSRHDVADLLEGFEADWHHRPFAPRRGSHLVWCPGARARICQFIDDAKHRLWVENERFQDMAVIERLVRAARRGVKVSILARRPHMLKRDKLVEGVGGLRILDDTGVKVHQLRSMKLHGKMLLADGVAAIIGSINLAPGSLDSRRELSIEVRNDEVVDRLSAVVRADWEHSRPMDLTDAGLLDDLDESVAEGSGLLALGEAEA